MKFACALVFCVAAASANAQWLRFQFQSDPGDWVGGGQSLDLLYIPQNSAFFSANLFRGGSNGPDTLQFSMMHTPISTHYLIAWFGTDQLGTPLAPGTYLNAMRAPFADPGRPGLDVLFEHRGSNTLTGSYTIDQIEYQTTGVDTYVLNKFKATFEQHSEGNVPAMRGTVTYSSVPEPATLAVLLPGLMLALKRRRK